VTDTALCESDDNCVLNGQCYNTGNIQHGFNPGGHDNSAICRGNGDEWLDVDNSQGHCQGAGHQWIRAGEAGVGEYGSTTNGGDGTTECCGDDADELFIDGECFIGAQVFRSAFKTPNAYHIAWNDVLTDSAWCESDDKCVLNGVCYDTGDIQHGFNSGGHDNSAICRGNGDEWLDVDNSQIQCERSGHHWVRASGTGVGEYGNSNNGGDGTTECCGDDALEYYSAGQCNREDLTTVLLWNIMIDGWWDPSIGYEYWDQGRREKVIDVILEQDADIVLLQEVTTGMYADLKADLSSKYPSDDNSHYVQDRGGSIASNAIFSKIPMTHKSYITYPPGRVCPTARIQGIPTFSCHLPAPGQTPQQIEANVQHRINSALSVSASTHSRDRIILGGDFNTQKFPGDDEYTIHNIIKNGYFRCGYGVDHLFSNHPCTRVILWDSHSSRASDHPAQLTSIDFSGNTLDGTDCNFDSWGVHMQSGDSIKFYTTSSPPAGRTCASVGQTRTCSNGVLSGDSSFFHKYCIQ